MGRLAPLIAFHVWAALPTLMLGTVIFARPKGTPTVASILTPLPSRPIGRLVLDI